MAEWVRSKAIGAALRIGEAGDIYIVTRAVSTGLVGGAGALQLSLGVIATKCILRARVVAGVGGKVLVDTITLAKWAANGAVGAAICILVAGNVYIVTAAIATRLVRRAGGLQLRRN